MPQKWHVACIWCGRGANQQELAATNRRLGREMTTACEWGRGVGIFRRRRSHHEAFLLTSVGSRRGSYVLALLGACALLLQRTGDALRFPRKEGRRS